MTSLRLPTTFIHNTTHSSPLPSFPNLFPFNLNSKSNFLSIGFRSINLRNTQDNIHFLCSSTYNALSIHHSQRQFIEWEEETEQIEREGFKVLESKDVVRERINKIKSMLSSMGDGEISISAYDTAWVALVKDVNGNGSPQFPSSIQWIVENQLPDGSWGDRFIFSSHDRIINTLACVIALKTWNIYPGKCEKGLHFIRKNMCKLDDENTTHMPIGFEVVFPSLMEIAHKLGLEVPDENSFALQDIYNKRKLKLQRIPKEMMHVVPTTLLHSLEGMGDLDWEKLLKLQSFDGSFLFSPSSTAFALMQTNDEKCLHYLQKAVQRFNGGVPNVYPVDMFERVWAVDRMERLGISRYFQSEIKECLEYVYRHWTKNGVCWARNSKVYDIDDTAMGFRLLRLYGYDLSADVFKQFEKDGEFFCFKGQSTQAVTGIYNLFRASQLSFPGETILSKAKSFSSKFLLEKQASNQLLDKWIITKDLPGEVGYALDVPWYASLPRVETRFYIEQYGGEDDVWIGKTLYRMPNVNNNTYLELAKIDYNNCQTLHQHEWLDIQKWYKEHNLGLFGVDGRKLLEAYFLASSTIFEPERSIERLAWTQTSVLVQAVSSYFKEITVDRKKSFIDKFITASCKIGNNIQNRRRKRTRSLSSSPLSILNKTRAISQVWGSYDEDEQLLLQALVSTLHHLSLDILVCHGNDVHRQLLQIWETHLMQNDEKERDHDEAMLLVRTITLCSGGSHLSKEEILLSHHPHLHRLVSLASSLCHQLISRRRRFLPHPNHNKSNKVHNLNINGSSTEQGEEEDMEMMLIESNMQELAQCVLENDGIDRKIKKTFLDVVKSYYYTAYFSPAIIDHHIAKVLFERVA